MKRVSDFCESFVCCIVRSDDTALVFGDADVRDSGTCLRSEFGLSHCLFPVPHSPLPH